MKKLATYVILLIFLRNYAQTKTTYTYAIKGIDTLKMDVYTPKNINKKERLPALLWMHGGGFSGGARDNVDEVKMMKYLANKKDYIGISISYRLLLKDVSTGFGCDCPKTIKLEVFRQAVIDYLDAANYIFEHNDKLQIDTTKVIAGGSSAGAEGVLNAVYLKHFFIDDISKYKAVNFSGVMALAGALVSEDYISEKNAIPTVMFHGTEDNLVPIGKAPHHYCSPDKLGYLLLNGSEIIAKKLNQLNASYYFHKKVGGNHDLAQIPFDKLDEIINFFNQTIIDNQVIQTKNIITK